MRSGLGVEDNKAHKIPAAEVQPERKESHKHRKKGEGWLSLEINVKVEVMAQARCCLEEGIYSERSSNPSKPMPPPKTWLRRGIGPLVSNLLRPRERRQDSRGNFN